MNSKTISRQITSLFMMILVTFAYCASADAAIYYVNASATGGNGTSWSKAFNNLDSALSAARVGGPNQIWVAKGTYKPRFPYVQAGYTGNPTQANLRTFLLPSNVSIYGGFTGNETSILQRNPDKNLTVFSGDLSGNDINDSTHTQFNKGDNAWHVLTAIGSTGVLLDGIIVTDGYAGGLDAGSISPPLFTISDLTYTYAAGGGLLMRNGAVVKLNNVQFVFNASDTVNCKVFGPDTVGAPPETSVGGAVAVIDEDTTLTVNNSVFNNNTAFGVGGKGGAISSLLEGDINVTLSSFNNNIADRNGGAVHSDGGHLINITASNFKNNNVVGTILPDASGGGIGVNRANLNVLASNFQNNSSGPIAGGGGIFFHIPFDDGEEYDLNVNASLFDNNTGASFGGGAIIILANNAHVGSTAIVSNSAFTNNTAGVGGAIYADGVPMTFANNLFYSNHAWTAGGAIMGTAFGNAVFGATNLADRDPIAISNSIFAGNTLVGIPPSAIFAPTDFFNIVTQVFSGGAGGVSTMENGGGAVAGQLGANMSITNSSFLNNKASIGKGGALLVGGSLGNPTGLSEAYVTLKKSFCFGNSDMTGNNNTKVRDLANLGNTPNGVSLVSDGTCP